MRVAIVYANEKTAQMWRDAIASELHDMPVEIWRSGSDQPVDYAIGWGPPAEFFEQQPGLRAFFTTGAGVEHTIDNPALPPDLPVIRVEDAGMGPQMVDYCRYEVLSWMQRRDDYAAQQAEGVWKQHWPSFRDEWPIGVFGLGVLGRQVAAAFAADGFPVNAYSRSEASAEPNVKMFSDARGPGQFEAFMQATRVLAILAPLTPATQDKFDRRALQMLPKGAYVINIARGGLIVDEALLELLDSGHLAGAALDVFRQEPLPAEHRFWTHPKVRVTPHVAALTPLGPASKQIAEKIRRLARNESVTGIVERARGY
jgi:glyoxylate/hydroxypyruvate reductase A